MGAAAFTSLEKLIRSDIDRTTVTLKPRLILGKWWLQFFLTHSNVFLGDDGPHDWNGVKKIHDELVAAGFKKEQ